MVKQSRFSVASDPGIAPIHEKTPAQRAGACLVGIHAFAQ